MAWQGKSAYQGRTLWFDRSVSEALVAAFAIAGQKAPKLKVGANPDTGATWSYDVQGGVFYVPIMPSATMTDEQEHLFRAAIAHEIAGQDKQLAVHRNIAADVASRPDDMFPGVAEGTRPAATAREQVNSLAQGLSTAMVDAHVTKRWPGMARSLRRATESLVASAVERVVTARKEDAKARKRGKPGAHPDALKFQYSELALLAGYAANGGNLRTLLHNVNFDVEVPDDLKQMADQLAEAADAEGLAPNARELVPTAMRWLRHFDQPPEPPESPDADGDEGEGEGEGEGQAKPPGGGQGSGNPYDQATAHGDLAHQTQQSLSSQAGNELQKLANQQGGGHDPATYVGETKSFPWTETKGWADAHTGQMVMYARQHRYDQFGGLVHPTTASQQEEIAWFDLHYDRDVGVLAQALRQALRGPTITRQPRHQMGRFNPRNVARYLAGNRDVFDRVTYQPGDKVAVSILVDASGSMNARTHDGTRLIGQLAMRAACVVGEALHRMGVAPRLAVYTTRSGLAAGIHEISDHKTNRAEFAKRRQYAGSRNWAVGGTPTLPAMTYELEALIKRDESQRFLFIITDGEDGFTPEEHRHVIERARRRGVTTIVLATGGDLHNWTKYKDGLEGAAIVIPVEPEKMGPTMARALVKELMRARMLASRR